MKTDLWVNNFSVHRSGYHLAAPVLYGIINSQKILFGKKKPPVLRNYFMIFEGPNMIQAIHKKEELRELIENTIKEIFKNPKKLNKIHKETYKLNDQYLSFARYCAKINLRELSDAELGKIYLKLIDWQERAHQHAMATTWYLDSDGEDFSKLLIEKTKEFCHSSGAKINFADAFSVLTTSTRDTLGAKEEMESLEVMRLILKDKQAKKIFQNLRNFQIVPVGLSENLARAIQKHFEKWRWLAFNYMGPAYEIDFFLKMWSDLVKQKFDVKKEIQKKKNWAGKIMDQKKTIIRELKIDKKWRTIYNIAADVVNLKGYRKECCFHGFFVMDAMLREMAKRLNLARSQMYLLTFQEIGDIFLKEKKVDANQINKRNGFTILDFKKGKIRVFTGNQAKKYFSKINLEKEIIDKNVSELQGTCACSGQAKGIVKMINFVEDMPKMKKGDVMVAHTTFPNLVPAMKLASAIITEDGGMTCHAAIVARELETPCITGIKTATKVLKDGDLVEINADEGLVKIVKRK
ncbi:MAG: PEP-utilizing enzyme [Candidatus Moranbacteria bacterium]|nr:PEP-utilizing enzyme [Candidatus Moranbacteria bacterium]